MTTANDFLGSDDNHSEDPNTQVENPLEILVGEGKKFKSVEDLARGKIESDNFIKRIQEENRTLREEMNSRARLEELVNKLSTPSPSTEQVPPRREEELPPSSGLTEADLNKFWENKRKQLKEEENIHFAQSELEKVHGPNWRNIVQQKAQQLGLTKEDVFELVKSRPQVVLEIAGKPVTPQSPSPRIPNNSINTDAKPSGISEWDYCEKVRKENPKLYYGPEFQKRVLKAWQERQ